MKDQYMSQWLRYTLYFSIAFLTAGVTDPFVLLAQNDPSMLSAMHPFQWTLIFFRSLLAGLVTLKAVAGRRLNGDEVDPTKVDVPGRNDTTTTKP